MHEVGIISAMLGTIRETMKAEKMTKVETIVLEVGEISGAIPHYMEECFPAAVYKTEFQDTKLEMIVIPGIVKCKKCGHEFNGAQENLVCPKCGNDKELEAISGRELNIKEIRGY